MLKYKINILGADITRKELFPKRILVSEDENNVVFEFEQPNLPAVEDGNTLFINRGDNDEVYIEDERYISYINQNEFTISYFNDYELTNYFIEEADSIYCPGQEFNKCIKIIFFEDIKHDFFAIRKANVREDLNCPNDNPCPEEEEIDIPIKDYIYYHKNDDDNYTYYKSEYIRYCTGDYAVANGLFLMKSIGIDDNGYYIFDTNSFKNTKQTLYFYNDNDEKVEFECVIPFNGYQDNRNEIYFLYKDGESEDIVEALKNYKELYTENNKYYKKENFIIKYTDEGEEKTIECLNITENSESGIIVYTEIDGNSDTINKSDIISIHRVLIPHKGTKFYKEYGDFKIKVPIDSTFESNMWQKESIIEQYVGERAQSLINPIVDMEKQVFIPVILDEDGDVKCDNVKEVVFNFNFLSRYVNGGIHTWKETVKATEDDKKHVKRLENDDNSFTRKDCRDVNSSHLLDLGFTDDDLRYQKMCVKKSFARFSYFNKQSRGSQALLYYSTTYLDSGEVYGLINKGENCIPCSMSVSNSFNRMKSSEGYYLYLFPNVVDINKDENGWGTIYMKIDFNHAKYGYTIPMSAPSSETVKNKGYIENKMDEDGNVVNIYQEGKRNLDNDIYIPVKVRYNVEKNRYEWCISNRSNFIENNANDGTIAFNLYEPIINFQETAS